MLAVVNISDPRNRTKSTNIKKRHAVCLQISKLVIGFQAGAAGPPFGCAPAALDEIWEYCQTTRKVQAQVLQSLRVLRPSCCRELVPGWMEGSGL